MKTSGRILRVVSNTKRREFVIDTKAGKYVFPYSQLKLPPSPSDPLTDLYVDKQAGNSAFTYRLASGKEDSILLDNVLWFNQDPELLRRLFLNDLTFQANQKIRQQKTGKRYLVRKLNTSATQLYRLLDPACYNKTIDQMLKLLVALGVRIEIKTREAA